MSDQYWRKLAAITDGGIDSWDEIALDIAAKAQDMRA
jgi:hypothetical protein